MSEMEDQVAQSSHHASAQQEKQVWEQHINDQQLFQANILQNVRDGIIVTDLQGTISYWNIGATQIFGYQPEEMLGQTPALLYPDINQQPITADLQHILAGNDYGDVWKGRTKSGQIVW